MTSRRSPVTEASPAPPSVARDGGSALSSRTQALLVLLGISTTRSLLLRALVDAETPATTALALPSATFATLTIGSRLPGLYRQFRQGGLSELNGTRLPTRHRVVKTLPLAFAAALQSIAAIRTAFLVPVGTHDLLLVRAEWWPVLTLQTFTMPAALVVGALASQRRPPDRLIGTICLIALVAGILLVPLSEGLVAYGMALLVVAASVAYLYLAKRDLDALSTDASTLLAQFSPISFALSLLPLLFAYRSQDPFYGKKALVHEPFILVLEVIFEAVEWLATTRALAILPHTVTVAAMSVPRALLVTLFASSRSKSALPDRMPTTYVLAFAAASLLLARADTRLVPARIATMLEGGREHADEGYFEKGRANGGSNGSSHTPSRRLLLVLFASLVPLLAAIVGSASIPPRLLGLSDDGYAARLVPGLATSKAPKTVDIVIAYYDEEFPHLNDLINEMLAVENMQNKTTRIIVYNKGDKSTKEIADGLVRADEIHTLENTGREGGTYLHHILRNYDVPRRTLKTLRAAPGHEMDEPLGLADHTAFLQGHLAWIGVANDRLKIFTDRTGYLHYAPYVHNVRGLDKDNGYRFPYIRDIFVLFKDSFMPPTAITTAWAAQFIVSKQRILGHPKSKYQSMLDLLVPQADHWLLDSNEADFEWEAGAKWDRKSPWLGHALERSWPLIFNCDDYKMAEQCPKYISPLELCQCFDDIPPKTRSHTRLKPARRS